MREAVKLREERNELVIYPEYFDRRLSRRLGRKLNLESCIENPSVEEIIEALKKVKIRILGIEERSHPANWIEQKGRIRILKPSSYKKRALLNRIASLLKEIRKKKLQKKIIEQKKKRKVGVKKYLERVIKESGRGSKRKSNIS